MYLSFRAAFIRNISVSLLNGAITLIILLIAPMGLAGVIMNTALVTIASFANATLCDRIVHFLQPPTINAVDLPQDSSSSSLEPPYQK